MDNFPLSEIDGFSHILKQIVKKFTAVSGPRFYRSCREAKNLIDTNKPVWSLPDSKLAYYPDYREGPSFKFPIQFFSIEKVFVVSSDPAHLEQIVLPELQAVGGVGTMFLNADIRDEYFLQLFVAAKPERLSWDDRCRDFPSATFNIVQNLEIRVCSANVESLEDEQSIPTRGGQADPDSATIGFDFQILTNFIEKWLMGESIGTLKRLNVRIMGKLRRHRIVETVGKLRRHDTQKHTRSFQQTPDSYILERSDGEKLQIRGIYTHGYSFVELKRI